MPAMTMHRREFLAGVASLGVASLAVPGPTLLTTAPQGAAGMHGLIGKMLAAPGQRDALVALLLEGTGAMPGCLSYVVATDPADENAIWLTEVWDSKESHQASLALPAVRATIAKARPLIAGFEKGTETRPVGGVGLAKG